MVREHAWRASAIGVGPVRTGSWPAWAVLAGCGPLLVGYALGIGLHQPVSALALWFLLVGAVRDDRPGVALGVLALGFAAHSALAITLASSDPGAGAALVDGPDYWARQLAWICSGTDPEYEVANWLPAHVQLFAAVVLLAALSWGLLPLLQGLYEVDLMNHYVGQVLAASAAPLHSLPLAWHPWSVLRGLCYLVLVVELASWSLSRWTGRPLSTPRARRLRWALAVGLFAADCAVKYLALDFVRDGLLLDIAPLCGGSDGLLPG